MAMKERRKYTKPVIEEMQLSAIAPALLTTSNVFKLMDSNEENEVTVDYETFFTYEVITGAI